MALKTNTAGRAILETFETPKDGDPRTPALDPYLDPVDVWTIGYGHALTDATGAQLMGEANREAATAQYPNGISLDQAKQMLDMDLLPREMAVTNLVHVAMTENQFSALVCLAFNIGVQALATSTLLRYLNGGDMAGAAAQFGAWTKGLVDGKLQTLPGLVTRREAERMLFVRADFVPQKPLLQTRTIVGALGGAGATAASVVSQLAPHAMDVATNITNVTNDPQVQVAAYSSGIHWIPVALSVLAAVAFGVIITVRVMDRHKGVH